MIVYTFDTKDLLIFYDEIDILLDYFYLVASGYNKQQVFGSATVGNSTALGTWINSYSPPTFSIPNLRIQYGCIGLIGLYFNTLNLQLV